MDFDFSINPSFDFEVNRETPNFKAATSLFDEVEAMSSPQINWKTINAKEGKDSLFTRPTVYNVGDERRFVSQYSDAIATMANASEFAPNEAYGQIELAAALSAMSGKDIKESMDIIKGGSLQIAEGMNYQRPTVVQTAVDTYLSNFYRNRAGDAFTMYMIEPNEQTYAYAQKCYEKSFMFKTAEKGNGWFADNVITRMAKTEGMSSGGRGVGAVIRIGGKALSVVTVNPFWMSAANWLSKIWVGLRAGSSQAGLHFFELSKEMDANGVKMDMSSPAVKGLFALDVFLMGGIEVGLMEWTPSYRLMTNILTPQAISRQFAVSTGRGLLRTGGEFALGLSSEAAEEWWGGLAEDTLTNAVYDWSNKHNGTAFPLKDFQDIIIDASKAFGSTIVDMIPTVAFSIAFGAGAQGLHYTKAANKQAFTFNPNVKQGVINSTYILGSEKLRKEAEKEQSKAKESGSEEKQETAEPQTNKRVKVVQTANGGALATEEDAQTLKDLYKQNPGKSNFDVIVEAVDINDMSSEDRASRLNMIGAIINGGQEDGDVIGYADGALVVKDDEARGKVMENLSSFADMQAGDGNYVVTPIVDGKATRIEIITKAEADARKTDVRSISTWQFQNMRRQTPSRMSSQEFLRQSEVQYAFKSLVQQVTGMTAEEVDAAFDSDVDSISMRLPAGTTWENLSASAMFMPIMSQITGRTTDDLLAEGSINIDVTGRMQYVDRESNRAMEYDEQTGKVRLVDENGNVTKEYAANDTAHVASAYASMTKRAKDSYTVHVNRNARANDIVHELMHITRRMASPERLAGFAKAYGEGDLWLEDIKDNGDGTYTFNGQTYGAYADAENAARVNEERFVQDFMQYLRDGSAPNAEIAGFFGQLKQFLQSFLNTYNDKLSADTVRAFEKLLNGEVDIQPGQTVEQAVEDSERTLTDEQEAEGQDETLNSYTNPEGEMLYSLSNNYEPEKVGHGYKLFEQDTRTGELYPLFIGKNEPTKVGVWNIAENIPTKGFANRPGWHIGSTYPLAVWLLGQNGQYNSQRGKNFKRVWCEVSYPMDVDYQRELDERGIKDIKDHTPENGYYRFREANGEWIISGALRIDKVMSDADVKAVLDEQGIDYNAMAREQIQKHFKTELPSDYKLYSLSPSAQEQYDAVVAKYKGTDQWLKAPNGKQTNLTERQWVMVRTPNFIRWFGDWINDPENASKVVDENGEPKVVYHWRFRIFDVFDMSRARQSMDIVGAYFSENPTDTAEYGGWTGDPKDIPRLIREGKRVSAFLNIRNPIRNPKWDYGVTDTAGLDERNSLLAQGYDGAIRQYAEDEPAEYIAFNSNQIKSATDNNGEFSNENNSILYSLASDRQWQVMDANTQRRIDADYEYTRNLYYGTDKWMKAPNGQPTNLTERQWIQVRTPAFKEWFGDWENDPENASKMIDTNGEPIVFYHGSDSDFDTFEHSYIGTAHDSGFFGEGFYFAFHNFDSYHHNRDEASYYGPVVKGFFLNIRNPFDVREAIYGKGGSLFKSDVKVMLNIMKNFPEVDWGSPSFWKDGEFQNYTREEMISLIESKWDFAEKHSRITELESEQGKEYVLHIEKENPSYEWDVFSGSYETTREEVEKTKELTIDRYVREELGLYDVPYSIRSYMEGTNFTDVIKQRGFDGIVQSMAGDEAVVFNSNQIKSATDNVGTFSRDTDNTLFSLAPAVGTEEFNQWFSGSKVVDAQGNPLVVYHGSPVKGIDEFNPRGAANGGEGLIYATDNEGVADIFSMEQRPGSSAYRVRFTGRKGQVYPVYMDIKRPLDMRNLTDADRKVLLDAYRRNWGDVSEDYFNQVVEAGNHQILKDMAFDVINDLEAFGYDGLIAYMMTKAQAEEYGTNYVEYAAVRPEQVKRLNDAESILYSLQNNDLPLDFYRNGGTIRYGNEEQFGQENQEGTADSTGLRGYIEYGVSDGGDNGRLVDWRASDDEVEPEAHRSAQRPYLERGDIAGGLDRSGRGASGRSQLLRRLNTVKGKSYTGVYFYELNKTPETLNKFIKSLNHTRENEKTGVFVSAKSLEELQKDSVRVFMSGDGNTGYAIEYDYKGKTGLNNLVAVFNNSMNGPKTAGAVYSILADAIEHGANILDCFADPKLLRSYSQMGFVPTGTVKFSEQALEKEDVPLFKKNKLKGFPVVAMYYVDRNINDTMDKLSDRKDSEWNTGAPIHKYESDGYFSALGERDAIARDHLFGNRPEYRTNPENYRLGTRIGGAIGANPSPLSEATGHGIQNWEDIPGREAVAEKIAGNLMGGAYKKQKDGTELRLPSPIPIRRQEGEGAIAYLRRVARYGAENIKTIFRALHENVITREKKWYDNAHAFAVSMMNMYNLSIGQAAGIIATLSPNYEWDKNMALADIVADVMTNASNSKPSERMISYIREKYTDWTDERVNGFASKTLSQMSDEDAKNFIIVAIQAGEIDKTYMPTFVAGIGLHPAKGKRFGLSVGKDADVLKAVSMYRDGSLLNISDKLSKEAKVRSFYNNILVPGSDRGEMTADTWALRGFFLGMNPKYSDEMRNILFQGQGGAGTGLTAVVNEGFRIAADEISAESDEDFLPQQIQSIVWTGIKAAWDNATKAGKRDALNAAWESGDVDTIRAIFTELINKYQPEAEVADEVEGLTLSRRAEDSTIFDEGSSSTQYNNLRRMTEESYMTTRQAAEAYQQAGGRESLNESVLFSLSPAKQAEVLQARKDEIQKAVEAGVYVSTEYLNEFRGEPWADLELELRDWMAENPEVVSLAREADSLEKFKEEYNKKYNKPAEGEEQQGDADNDAWLETIYRYSNASSLEDRDRQFVAEWTASEDKTLELAKTIREYMNSAVSPRAKTRAGYMATRSLYNSFRGVDQKVRGLQDGSKRNTKRATSEQIQEAQRLIQENPRAYRNAYMLATANGDVSNLELIDDDIAREMFNLEQEQEEARTLKTDYRANIKDLRQKINDAERDIRKAGEDPEKLDAEATKEKLETAKQRVKELNAMIKSAEAEVDRMIERMGNEVEKVNDKLEERRARVRELRSQLTDANVEVRRLSNALDALRRWKEAKLASDYRVKRIRQIKRLSEFNPASIDAAYAQALFWVNSLFDMTDEVRQERKSLMDQIAGIKAQIDAAKGKEDEGDTVSALTQKLLYLRNMEKQSDWLAPPAQLAQYLPDLFVRADNRPSAWTAEELDNLLMALKQMRHDGKMMLEQKQTARLNRLLSIGYQYFMDRVGRMAQLGQSEDRFGNVFDYMSSRALEEDINTSIKEATDPKAFKSFILSYAKLQRLARLLDGDREGVLYDWFVRENWKHQGEELTQIRRRMEAAQAEWKRLGLKASDLAKEGFKGTKQNGTEYSLTRGQMIGVYVYSLNEIGKEKLTHYNGNNISEADINAIISKLTPEEKAWGDYMLKDFEDNWQRLADVFYRGWNMILGKRDNYFTFVPSSAASSEQLSDGMDVLATKVGKEGKSYTEKGFTKEINPNAVYPLELDVTRSWNWQVRRQEHFIAYGEWAKDSQYLLDQSQIKNLGRRTIGKAEMENFEKIVNYVIGGETSNNDFDRAYTRWLAKRNSAVLVGNVGTILKQGPSWLAAFNGDVNPGEVLKNAVAANATLRAFLAEHPEIADMMDDDVDTATRFIWANAPEMKNRQIDMDIAEQLSRMDGNRFANLFNPTNRVIAKWTMGLVDRLVVNNLWMAKYYTEFEAQKKANKSDEQAHREAVFKASQFISETQPTSQRMDQSAKQIDAKSSSFLRGIMVFTNQVTNTFNQLYVDVPMAIRRKNWKKAISTIASTMVMMVTVGLLSGRFWKKGDEDDEKYRWRLAREILATIAQVSAPGFGSIAATVLEYGTGYESYIFGLDTLMTGIKSLMTPSDRKTGWEKLGGVMEDLATEAGYAVGAPVTPLKNLVKSVKKGDPGYMLGGTWGQIIESNR